MAPTTPWRIRFKRWCWIVGVVVVAAILAQALRKPDPDPPDLALHSLPFTILPGELPWPDRWLMRGPSWNWLWTLRSQVWPKNPSVNLDYGLWELRDPEKFPALPFVAAQTNDDWTIKVLNLDQLATATDALNANAIGAYHMRIVSGEGIQSAMTGSLLTVSCRIEAALRLRGKAVYVASAVMISPLPGQIGNTNATALAFEATVPDKGAVLLVSRHSNPPRACLMTVAKNP